ncbi:MAG: hypothetical protein HC869_08390 [Rhodospirillales bacterium]|nr:hypothetical protein [Rhodospirillales bacterium]
MARMTNVLLLGAVATTLVLSTQADAACNARGQHCGRPAWAANALSGPTIVRRHQPSNSDSPQPPATSNRRRSRGPSKEAVPHRVVKAVVPLVKFADGEGRQYDPASQVWFDGESQCWSGTKQFTFKDGDWFYGKKEWAEATGLGRPSPASRPSS